MILRGSHPELFYEKNVYVYGKVSGKQLRRSRGSGPYLKRDFDANFFPGNVE